MKTAIYFLISLFAVMGTFSHASYVSSGEKVTITIKGVPASEQTSINGEYVVDGKGLLYMPMIEAGIKAAGSSSSTVARRIEAAYKSAKIYTSPRITIITIRDDIASKRIDERENRFVTVAGHVKRPGPVQYRNNLTIYEAVAAAGDADTFGAMNRVELERDGRKRIYNLKKTQHRMEKVKVGDVITVPQKNPIGR